MALSNDAVKRLMIATTSQDVGAEIADAINLSTAKGTYAGYTIPTIITATAVSQTTDFGSLLVGDKLVRVSPTLAYDVVVTVGTVPAGITVAIGDVIVVLRAAATSTDTTVGF